MSTIKYIDTDGNKNSLLPKGTFGYDDYQSGGDKGRVYIGTGEENLPLAKKSELAASAISVEPQGNLSSNTVQLALEELQSSIDTFTTVEEW
jgi:hypothetical protein